MTSSASQPYSVDGRYIKKLGREITASEYLKDKIDAIPEVVDNVHNRATDKALSANMGRLLQDQIDELKTPGRFLGNWNSSTGLSEVSLSNNPYVYGNGDYFIVSVVSNTTNYKPNGDMYVAGIASDTVEEDTVNIDDRYMFNGNSWIHIPSGQRTFAIDTELSNTSTSAVENRVIAAKFETVDENLDSKANASSGATGEQPAGNPGDIYVDEDEDKIYIKGVDSWKDISESEGGGTSDYEQLTNKPAIDGNILTSESTSEDLKLLSSDTINVITDSDYSDIIIQDNNGNALVQFAEGHIKTKNFDSQELELSSKTLNLKGKTVGFLGDSITYGVGATPSSKRYSTVFCSIAECTERNMGISGTCLAANTKNGKTSQRFITRVTNDNINGLDLLYIFGGTNDISYDIKPVGDHFVEETITGSTYIGTKKRVPNPDNETFSGALHELILAIRAINPSLPIIYMTPLPRGSYWTSTTTPRSTSSETNANGNYISDFVDAIKDICAFYSIPVFYMTDHFPYDLSQDTKTNSITGMSTDGIHPNNKGHEVLAQALYRWTITNF